MSRRPRRALDPSGSRLPSRSARRSKRAPL
jgi:hypothetical protein